MENLEIVEPLRELPDRMTKVEEQIVLLRTEMRGEFSAIRRDMATDLVERIKLLGESWSRSRTTSRKKTP